MGPRFSQKDTAEESSTTNEQGQTQNEDIPIIEQNEPVYTNKDIPF